MSTKLLLCVVTFFIVASDLTAQSRQRPTSNFGTMWVSGTVFRDANRNGTMDTGEQGVLGAMLRVDSGGSTKFFLTDSMGYGSREVDTGSKPVRLTLPSGFAFTTPSDSNGKWVSSGGQSFTFAIYRVGIDTLPPDTTVTIDTMTGSAVTMFVQNQMVKGFGPRFALTLTAETQRSYDLQVTARYHDKLIGGEREVRMRLKDMVITTTYVTRTDSFVVVDSTEGLLRWTPTMNNAKREFRIEPTELFREQFGPGDRIELGVKLLPISSDKKPLDNIAAASTTYQEGDVGLRLSTNVEVIRYPDPAGSALLSSGKTIRYSVAIKATTGSYNVKITDTLPPGLDASTFRRFSPNAGTLAVNGRIVTWTIASQVLWSYYPTEFQFEIDAAEPLPVGTLISNRVMVQLDGGTPQHSTATEVYYGLRPRETMITGMVFGDKNANGVRDSGELGVRTPITVRRGWGDAWGTTDTAGRYRFVLQDYVDSVRLKPQLDPFLGFKPSSQAVVAAQSTGGKIITHNFALESVALVGVEAHPSVVRWGRGRQNQLFVRVINQSGVRVEDASMLLTFDPRLKLWGNGGTNRGLRGGMTVSYATADGPGRAKVTFSLNSHGDDVWQFDFIDQGAFVLGEQLNFCAQVVGGPTHCINTPVLAPSDPNDKNVVPGKPITLAATQQGQSLEYLVRFQNVGTIEAVNVIIRDTLDSRLDRSTLTLIDHSHPMDIRMDTLGNMAFVFNQIYLPDSATDEPGSHGHVRYSIMPQRDLVEGSTVSNAASIYFDFEDPVRTNTATTLIANPPIARFSSDSVCLGDSTLVVATSTVGVGTLSHTWILPDSEMVDGDRLHYVFTAPGEHRLTLVALSSTGLSDTVTGNVTVLALPDKPTITREGTTLRSSATSGNQWFRDGAVISGATGTTYVTDSSGVYTVLVSNTEGCTSLSDTIQINLSSSDVHSELASSIGLYPNPTRGLVILELSQLGETKVEIYDIQGRQVLTRYTTDHRLELDLSGIAAGSYTVRVNTSKGEFTYSVVVE